MLEAPRRNRGFIDSPSKFPSLPAPTGDGMCVAPRVNELRLRRHATNEEEPMEAFKCGHCGRKFNSQEELQQHEKECVPARVK